MKTADRRAGVAGRAPIDRRVTSAPATPGATASGGHAAELGGPSDETRIDDSTKKVGLEVDLEVDSPFRAWITCADNAHYVN
jgi:hypothetical protein